MQDTKSLTLILDLDDTIFKTKSMPARLFEPFFEHLVASLKNRFDKNTITDITNDLWHRPFDVVLKKYEIPTASIMGSVEVLDSMPLELDITTYEDYQYIKTMPYAKILVTTGLNSLQEAKIRALNIAGDFTKIVINDTFKESKNKLDVFSLLQNQLNLNPSTTFVIGDNPDSEIWAGNALGFCTIQILREGVIKGDLAKHHIHTFEDLAGIINI